MDENQLIWSVGRISKLYLEARRIREHSSTGSGQTLVETFDLKPPPLFKKPTNLHSQNISSQPTRHVQPFPATHLPNQVATQSCRDITRHTETIMAKSSTSGFIKFLMWGKLGKRFSEWNEGGILFWGSWKPDPIQPPFWKSWPTGGLVS